MRFVALKIHKILDYVTVVAFALIPVVFGLSGAPAYLSYALSLIHLLMTVLTRVPLGFVNLIPIKVHRVVEALVGPVLLAVPWVLGFGGEPTARNVYLGAGFVIIVVGLVTNYSEGDV